MSSLAAIDRVAFRSCISRQGVSIVGAGDRNAQGTDSTGKAAG